MAYVITEACAGVKDGGCVTVCPADCIHEATLTVNGHHLEMMAIDADQCTDCGQCENECPVGAIYYESDLPKPLAQFARANAAHFQNK